MLPIELVTLILLLPVAGALDENTNTSFPAVITTTSLDNPAFAHPESSVPGFETLPTPSRLKPTGRIKPITEKPDGPDKVHTEISVPGFGTPLPSKTTARGSNRVPHEEISQTDFEGPSAPTAKPPSTRPPVPRPTVHTESPVPESALESGFKVPDAPVTILPNTQPQQGPSNANPGPATATPTTQQRQQQPNAPNSPNAPNTPNTPNTPNPQPSQPPSAPDILNNIALKIFEQNSSNGPSPSQNNETPAPKGVIPTVNGFDSSTATKGPNPAAPAAQATPNPEATTGPSTNPVITLAPEIITQGSSVLTLTPGLSTTIGSGTLATFVAITTNTAGQTVVVISATGTATTSTITSRPKSSPSSFRSVQVSTTGTAGPAGTTTGTPAATTGQAAGLWYGGYSRCLAALLGIGLGMAVLL